MKNGISNSRMANSQQSFRGLEFFGLATFNYRFILRSNIIMAPVIGCTKKEKFYLE